MTIVRSFNRWKAETILKLLALKAAHKGDRRIEQTVDTLITKLHYLKAREVASFLVLLHHAAALTDEFLSVLPTEEEIKAWFAGEE